MARRSDHSRDELRALIFQAAWSIVEKNGAVALTARAVAGDIGYTPGTIYNLFESMDDLILALNLKTITMLGAALHDPGCQAPDKTPVQNAKAMARHYMDFAKTNRQHWLLLYTHTLPPERFESQTYREAVDSLFAPLEQILAPAFAAPKGHKIKIAARALWASVHGIYFLEATGKLQLLEQHASVEDVVDTLIETFFAGLKT